MTLTQGDLNAAMRELGCVEAHQRPRAGGGVYCKTHSEYVWFESGISACRVAWNHAQKRSTSCRHELGPTGACIWCNATPETCRKHGGVEGDCGDCARENREEGGA